MSETVEALRARLDAAEEYAKTSPLQVYAHGMFCSSVCAPGDWTAEQVAAEAEKCAPAGTANGWAICADPTFRTGEPNPCPCNSDATRKHWLLEA